MKNEKLECHALVIGAGVIGLAISSKLARKNESILIEKEEKFGQETSSRSSEVIHSGIYYPTDSLKTETCIRGRELLYDFCKNASVFCSRIGKFIVATTEDDEAYLEKLFMHAQDVGVSAEWMTNPQIESYEPLIQVRSGIFISCTGIIDSHELMATLERLYLEGKGIIAYRHRVKQITKIKPYQWSVEVESPHGLLHLHTNFVINAAGLGAGDLSTLVLAKNYEHRFCRGRYFMLHPRYRFRHLIYPVPPKDGLGIHITLDRDGIARLGPDVDWQIGIKFGSHDALYDCDWDLIRGDFLSATRRYFPTVSPEDLSPGLIGIRPKLFVEGKPNHDFVIENFDGFIHCLGIESPGLTASLAIAEKVVEFVNT